MNLQSDNPALEHVWSMARRGEDEPRAHRRHGATRRPPQAALDAFRSMYPGKLDTIEKREHIDWSKTRGPRSVRPRRTGRASSIASGPSSRAARAHSLLRSVLRQPELGSGSRHPKREPGSGSDHEA